MTKVKIRSVRAVGEEGVARYRGGRSGFSELGRFEANIDDAGSWRCTFQGAVVPYGRWTRGSFWEKARRFREFRDIIRSTMSFYIRPPRIGTVADFKVRLFSWNPGADPDNCMKAVMDSLVGIAIRDDSWTFVRSQHIERSLEREEGWDIECRYTFVQDAVRPQERRARSAIKRKAFGTARIIDDGNDPELAQDLRDRLEEGFATSSGIESPFPRTKRSRRSTAHQGVQGPEDTGE